MWVYIFSVGRSGSAWLSTVLYSLGFNVEHEGCAFGQHYPTKGNIFSHTGFSLAPETYAQTVPRSAKIILLTRNQSEVQSSINKMVPASIDRVVEGFQDLYDFYEDRALILDYSELFTPETACAVANYLKLPPREVIDRWAYFRHMRITNHTMETEVKKTYEKGI